MTGDIRAALKARYALLRSGTAERVPLPTTARRAALTGVFRRLLSTTPIMLALLLAALLPRVLSLDDFYTTDEAYFWQGRVVRFSAAVAQADWANTDQTGHPGVTAMWLGSLGKALAERAGAPEPGPGAGARYLAYLRLPLAVANALAVSLGYLLLLRLLPAGTAALAALLWATSPFLIAHSRLLHLDALLTSLLSLSLLALLVAAFGPPGREKTPPLWRRPILLLSGALAGLAILTKAPGLLLLPFAGLLLFVAELSAAHPRRPLRRRAGPALARSLGAFLIWLAVAGLIFVALWPAMWVDPLGSLRSIAAEVIGNGGRAHSAGNFFMGQAVADPGWPFYAAVIRWRGDPPMTIGLSLLLGYGLWLLLSRRAGLAFVERALAADVRSRQHRVTLALIAFALLFLIALTLLAKKFDRYLLPIWPALCILAAVGMGHAARGALTTFWGRALLEGRLARGLLGLGLAATLVVPLFTYSPYYLAYYNPLLGGGATAQEVLLPGWGEGMEQVGAWLDGRPDFARGPVLSWLPETLKPFVRPTVAVYDLDIDTLTEPANYAVVYRSVAARDSSQVAEAFASQTPPLYTLRVHGITYATVHQLPRPFAHSSGAVFSGVHLRGITQEFSGPSLIITPSWDIQIDRPGGLRSFVHILDSMGTLVAQFDTVLDDGMFASWQAGQQFGTPMPISLPARMHGGEYQVVLGLYTPEDGQRLPLTFGQALPDEIDGPHAIEIMRFRRPAR